MVKILFLLITLVTFLFSQININTANKKELMNLYGVGEETAKNIIKYRKKHMFKNKKDILNVKGIGDKKYNKIKKEIVVSNEE